MPQLVSLHKLLVLYKRWLEISQRNYLLNLFCPALFSDIPRDVWEGILARNGWNEVDLRDARYNHIIHMVSAANGAEPFYSTDVS